MSGNEIEERGCTSLSPQQAVQMIATLGDPNLVAAVFDQFGWSFSEEVSELLKIVRQNMNLPAKLNAIKQLRTIMRESAEASGMIANVSRTVPGANGESTTFQAKGIAAALNPIHRKQVESTVKGTDDEQEEKHLDSGCNQRNDREGDGVSGGCSTEDGPEASDASGDSDERCGGNAGIDGEVRGSASGERAPEENPESGDSGGPDDVGTGGDDIGTPKNFCVQHNPPTSNLRLYPGVTGLPVVSGNADIVDPTNSVESEGAETAS